MEEEAHETPLTEYSSNVDTSRPFRSVKEAVAVFGHRILSGEMAFPLPPPVMASPWNNNLKGRGSDSSPVRKPVKREEEQGGGNYREDGLKKLEAELQETKKELRVLEKREAETEIALAALNAELHKSISRMVKEDTVDDKKTKAEAKETTRSSCPVADFGQDPLCVIGRDGNFFKTLAEILNIDDEKKDKKNKNKSRKKKKKEGYYGNNQKVVVKKEKPIVPLVWELFSWKKRNSGSAFTNTMIYSSPHFFK